MRVTIASLGCPKNLVDSEVMMGVLCSEGHEVVADPKDAEIIICNTCAFIGDAAQESVDQILELASYKREGNCRLLIVAGCLSQRYGERVLAELPEVDGIVGAGDFLKIAEVCTGALRGDRVCMVGEPKYLYNHHTPRLLFTPGHYAYLKIAEGCSNLCSYCLIPGLRGRYRSRDFDSIVAEAQLLTAKGVKELNLVAQDTTRYGVDLYGRPRVAELLRAIAKTEGTRWLRLLYTHPQNYTDDLLEVVSEEERVCKYLDLPIQHIADSMLRAMNRRVTRQGIEDLIQRLRRSIPGLALRTSLIVGFPGEGEAEFDELLDFVEKTRFERLGVFKYSKEEGTRAAELGGHIREEVKSERQARIIELQREISLQRNMSLVGSTIEVVIDERLATGDFQYMGRTPLDAPETDCSVFVKGEGAEIGDFVKVKILEGEDYDLFGEMLEGGDLP